MSVSPSEPSAGATPAVPPVAGEPRTGDYASFFRTTVLPLRRYVARLIGCDVEAEDIAQSAYARVFSAMQTKEVAHPRALLYTTARNLALDELRHRARAPFSATLPPATPASEAPSVERIVMAREEWDRLEHTLATLPEECRAVLILRTMERCSHEEIAATLGIPRKTAEKRLYRAFRLLHDALRTVDNPAVVTVFPSTSTGTGTP